MTVEFLEFQSVPTVINSRCVRPMLNNPRVSVWFGSTLLSVIPYWLNVMDRLSEFQLGAAEVDPADVEVELGPSKFKL